MKKVNFSDSVLTEANKVVDGCMGNEEAHCVNKCPMATNARGYIKLIGDQKYDEALKLIREKLFLPGVLGRICTHPCEDECRRNKEFNQPIAIATLKRFAADKADREELWDLETLPDTGKRVAVIGCGPTGGQAAIDLRRKGHAVTVYERLSAPGGMLRIGIPAYRLPREVIDFEYSYLKKIGVEMLFNKEIGKDISFAAIQRDFDSVIIAHGAQKSLPLSVDGEENSRVIGALDFLKKVSEGEAVDLGNDVFVIGGGNTAMDCARSAARLGTKVTVLYRRSREEMPADDFEIEEAIEEGVEFSYYTAPQSFSSDGSSIQVNCVKMQLGEPDEGRRRRPEEIPNSAFQLSGSTVITAVGQVAEEITEGTVATGRKGLYQAKSGFFDTAVDGVFIAGDAVSGGASVVESMAWGRRAAFTAHNFLMGLPLNAKELSKGETQLDVPLPDGVSDSLRVSTDKRESNQRKKDFKEYDFGFTEEKALEEAARCLDCSCRLCMKECIMMNDHASYPKEIVEPMVKNGKLDPMVAYSCNSCDNCKIVCPKDFDFKKIFIKSRENFVEANNGKSPIAGHKAIDMHQKLGFSRLFTTKRKKKEQVK